LYCAFNAGEFYRVEIMTTFWWKENQWH